MREIILDTETTGLKFDEGHRITEIGCLEIFNLMPTGKSYHVYVNPERMVSQEAVDITGLTTEFLRNHQPIKYHLQDFLDFIADSPLVIHNASFDMSFINGELARHDYPVIPLTRAVDTLEMARNLFPKSRLSLDALCQRYKIDNTNREYHGALLDAELLAKVYLELRGGRQPLLFAHQDSVSEVTVMDLEKSLENRQPIPARSFEPTKDELEKHAEMLKKINNPIWLQYI